jgi:phenylpyruvate tautomerase PptA (4-oxalocrotonate tautomerase family)
VAHPLAGWQDEQALIPAISQGDPKMPLVRIALMKGQQEGFGKKVGAIVYRAMVDTINVPQKDHFQIITEHDTDSLIFDPDYLGIARSDGVVFIQITLNEGRTVDMKKALYAAIAERLHGELALRREDVLINLVEVKKENWSFGNGIAQYA